MVPTGGWAAPAMSYPGSGSVGSGVLGHPGSLFGLLALAALLCETMPLGELGLMRGRVGPLQRMGMFGSLAAEAEWAISLCHALRVVPLRNPH